MATILLDVSPAITAAFAIGTLGFWILLLIAFIVITGLIENADNGGSWSTAVCAVTLICLYVFGAGQDIRSLWPFMQENVLLCVIIFFGYILAGAGWSLAKWWFFVANKRDLFLDEYKDRTGMTEYDLKSKMPKARDFKGRITSWMFYWPASALWTLVNEPVTKIFRKIYRKFEGSFEKISNKAFYNSEMKAFEAKQKESNLPAKK